MENDMKHIFSLLCLILISCSSTTIPWKNGSNNYTYISQKMQQESKPYILYFYGDNCSHCKNFQDILEQSNVKKLLAPYEKIKINPYENSDAKFLTLKLGVKTIPSFFVVLPGNKRIKIEHVETVTAAHDFIKRVKTALNNH